MAVAPPPSPPPAFAAGDELSVPGYGQVAAGSGSDPPAVGTDDDLRPAAVRARTDGLMGAADAGDPAAIPRWDAVLHSIAADLRAALHIRLPAAMLCLKALFDAFVGDAGDAPGATHRVPQFPRPFLLVGLAEVIPPFLAPGRQRPIGNDQVTLPLPLLERLEATFPTTRVPSTEPAVLAGPSGMMPVVGLWRPCIVTMSTSAREMLQAIGRFRMSRVFLPQGVLAASHFLSARGVLEGAPTVRAWRCPLCWWTSVALPVDGLLALVAATHGKNAADRLVPCAYCPAAFAGVVGLYRHYRGAHVGECPSATRCGGCRSEFPGRWASCPVCGRREYGSRGGGVGDG